METAPQTELDGLRARIADLEQRLRVSEQSSAADLGPPGGASQESQLMLLVDASRALLASPESTQVLSTILRLAQQFIQADAYAVWREYAEDWKLVASTGLSDNYERSVRPAAKTPILDQIYVIEDVESSEWVSRRGDAYRAEGIRSLLTVPLRIQDRVAGTMVFYYRRPRKFKDPETRIAGVLGNLAAAALGTADLYDRQAELREKAEAAERRSSFLANAGEVLASSLDYETTLASLAKLAVPSFADWCSVDIVDESGLLRPVAGRHWGSAKIEFTYSSSRRYPPRENDVSQVALRTGQAVM